MIDKQLLEAPIFFEPNRAWRCYIGGKLLDTFTGCADPHDGHFPEDWLASTTLACNGPNQQSPSEGLAKIRQAGVAEPIFFKDLLAAYPQQAIGNAEFNEKDGIGVLCKFLDSAIRLPIQCHPDIPYAQQYYNSDHGKSESWFILATREINGEKPYILMGFKPGVDAERFKQAVRDQDIATMEQSLHRVEVQPGDKYFIPGRLPHAIGPGVFLLEVQEPTDWVVQPEAKIGDTQLSHSDMWGPIDPEIGLDCFDYSGADTLEGILAKVKVGRHSGENMAGGVLEKVIDDSVTPCFKVDYLTLTGEMELAYPSWYIAIMVAGECTVGSGGQRHEAGAGDCFFVADHLEKLRYQAKNGDCELFLVSRAESPV